MPGLPAQLDTPRLHLRPIRPDDAAAVFASWVRDPRVTRFLTWAPHPDLATTRAYVADRIATPHSRTYVLQDRRGGGLLGAIDLRRPAPHRIGFGYALAPSAWGNGLMTEALRAALAWVQAQPDLWRMGDLCDADNHASARVMEKVGLRREGVLRRWAVHPALGPAPRDCISFAWARD
ncbi:MAG: GNAT family N-acetyltransferase [Rhodospirillales bacterium]|nr:GNAT family N-acetyltransferase [Rhodospirillales bacterium]MBN8903104.1 GNAT family N-acetyltransferase [Rhodospirillales bacterium]